MTRPIVVLYEDQLYGSKPANYGPNVLALACVADRIGEASGPYALRDRVNAVPKKGDSKVLAALADLQAFGDMPGSIVVLDLDRIRRLLKLEPACCKRDILDTLAARAMTGTEFVLLEDNMETVVRACATILSCTPPTRKPTPLERDAILHNMASAGEDARRELLHRVPSFGRLVSRLHHLLTDAG